MLPHVTSQEALEFILAEEDSNSEDLFEHKDS